MAKQYKELQLGEFARVKRKGLTYNFAKGVSWVSSEEKLELLSKGHGGVHNFKRSNGDLLVLAFNQFIPL